MTKSSADIATDKEQLSEVKAQADLLGIKYPANATIESVLKLIKAYYDKQPQADATTTDARVLVRREMLKLVRVTVTCNHTRFTGNKAVYETCLTPLLGDMSYVIPLNKPWHVPYVIYQQLLERYFIDYEQAPLLINGMDTGETTSKQVIKPLYNVTKLPMLTQTELDDLADKQKYSDEVRRIQGA